MSVWPIKELRYLSHANFCAGKVTNLSIAFSTNLQRCNLSIIRSHSATSQCLLSIPSELRKRFSIHYPLDCGNEALTRSSNPLISSNGEITFHRPKHVATSFTVAPTFDVTIFPTSYVSTVCWTLTLPKNSQQRVKFY